MNTPPSIVPKVDHGYSKSWHLGVLASLLLLAYLSYVGCFVNILDFIMNTHIEKVARAYLKTTGHETTRVLEVLSGIKSALALLQSSSGGITFFVDVQIQLGQVLNVISELIDRAWFVSLSSVAAVEGLKLLLSLSRLSMAPVLTLFFVTLGISKGLQHRAPKPSVAIAHVARLALFAALVVHFVVPLTLYSTAALGNFFFHNRRQEIREGFEEVYSATPKHKSGRGLHNEVKRAISEFSHSQGRMHNRTRYISRLTGNHILLSVAEHLVVPLVFLAIFWAVFRQFLEKLWLG